MPGMPYDNDVPSSGGNPDLAEFYYRWLGIPVSEQPANAYRLLGLALFEPDGDVIQSAADRQMAHVRTYQTGKHSAISQQILNELATATLSLLRPEKRAKYDQALRRQLFPAVASVPQAPPVPELAPMQLRIPAFVPPIAAPQSNRADSNPFEAITEMDRAATCGNDLPRSAIRKPAATTSAKARRAKSPSIAISIGIAAAGIVAVVVAIVIMSGAPQDDQPAAKPATPLVPRERPNSKQHDQPQSPSRKPNDQSRTPGVPILPHAPTVGELPGQQIPVPPLNFQGPSVQAGNRPIVNKPALVVPTDHVGTEQLVLASGTHFNVATAFHVDISGMTDKFEGLLKDHGVVFSKFSNGMYEYLASERRGNLDGLLAASYSGGAPAAYAAYSDGQLDGNLLAWREDGTRVLFVQFTHGEKSGILCLFDDSGHLRYVQEYLHDQPQWSYLIRGGIVRESFSHLVRNATADKELKAAAADVEAAVFRLRGGLRKVKKAARDYDEQQRRSIAAANSVAAREKIIARNNERDNSHAALIGALRQWSGL
jgi:hypothetical protein